MIVTACLVPEIALALIVPVAPAKLPVPPVTLPLVIAPAAGSPERGHRQSLTY